MKKLTFELEFITPAFIGGANQQAELRPASFVGLLRWWWRALKGECDIKKLREEEIKIFGGDGKMASLVYLRVEGDVRKGNNLTNEMEIFRKIFGSKKRRGQVIFFDAYPVDFDPSKHFEAGIMNSHYGDYYQSGRAPAD